MGVVLRAAAILAVAIGVLLVDGAVEAAVPPQTLWVSGPAAGSPQAQESGQGEVSSDGRTIAFASNASNLVSSDNNGTTDVFVRPLAPAGATELVSITPNGAQFASGAGAPTVSGDGRYVAFLGNDGTVVGLYLRDRATNTTESIALGAGIQPAAISADGGTLAFITHRDARRLGCKRRLRPVRLRSDR